MFSVKTTSQILKMIIMKYQVYKALVKGSGQSKTVKSWMLLSLFVLISFATANTLQAQCTDVPGQNIIEGTVFEDLNNDGLLTGGETGPANVDVLIYEDNAPLGTIDGGDVLVTTVQTDVSGNFSYNVTLPTGTASDNFSSNNFSGGSGWLAPWTTANGPSVSGGEANLDNDASMYRQLDLQDAVNANISFSYRVFHIIFQSKLKF